MHVDPFYGVAGSSGGAAGGLQVGGAAGSPQAGGVAGSPHAGTLNMVGSGGSITINAGNSKPVPITPDEQDCQDLADYYDIPSAWAQINEAGESGRKVGSHHQLSYVDGDTTFRTVILNELELSLFATLRGRFFTPFRIFVGHPTINTDKQDIEIMMAYPDSVAKSKEDVRNFWAAALNKNARDFYRVVYWDLWTWENAQPHYHDMYCTLDNIK